MRGPSTDTGTFSRATMGAMAFDWLEPPDRGNRHDVSCIPAGDYTATRVRSAKFGFDVFLLNNVPGRSGIEVHIANWAGDAALGYYSDLDGCMAPGYGVGQVQTPQGNLQQAILRASVAFRAFMRGAGAGPLQITIIPYGGVAA